MEEYLDRQIKIEKLLNTDFHGQHEKLEEDIMEQVRTMYDKKEVKDLEIETKVNESSKFKC